jgi:hypothetical protein
VKEKPKNCGTAFAWPVLSHLIGLLSQRESATSNANFPLGTFKIDPKQLFVTVIDHTIGYGPSKEKWEARNADPM